MKNLVLLVMLVAGLSLGCKSTPKRIAFTSLESVAFAVDIAMTEAGNMYKAGQVTEKQKEDLLNHYRRYQLSALTALEAVSYDKDQSAPLQVASLAQAILDLLANWKQPAPTIGTPPQP